MIKPIYSFPLVVALSLGLACDEAPLDESKSRDLEMCAVEGDDVPCDLLLDLGRAAILQMRGIEVSDEDSVDFRSSRQDLFCELHYPGFPGFVCDRLAAHACPGQIFTCHPGGCYCESV